MDFVSGLPLTPSKKDSILLAHFLPVHKDYSLQKLAKLYISEIMRLNRVPILIISDPEPRIHLDFSTAFHLQSERVIQILEDMLRGNREGHLPLAKFYYNNSFQLGIQKAPYKALYGRKCRTPLCWTKLGEKKVLSLELVQQSEKKYASNRQNLYANLKRKEIEYNASDQVFLKVPPWKKVLRFNRKGKLSSRFIGPYRILRESVQLLINLNYLRTGPNSRCFPCLHVETILFRPFSHCFDRRN
ncbi:DNA/RNA polymerases superfamily protein [Gossypium australe]|uniref:DNA/RNA polymerases superfamily protein n=1 Tax=Gossypium australe TaxID=47621 RepID=A0A5B6WSS5_9ROSI|nr:DNA/RNA polymerases superfamily protein [Gossypium australe]